MDRRTYRVTASVGGVRTLPWPFGLLDVDDDGLGVRSWHWAWWVPDSRVERHQIAEIQIRRIFGVAVLLITLGSGKTWKIQVAGSWESKQILKDLDDRGYVVGLRDRPAPRRRYPFYGPSTDSSAPKSD